MRFNDFLHFCSAACAASQQDDLQPNFFSRQFSLKSAMFLTKSCPGEDGAGYKEALILGKEGMTKMVEWRMGKLGRCLA